MSNLNTLFANKLYDLKHYGIESAPRGLQIKELIGDSLRLEEPRNRIVNFKNRNTSLKYLLAEFIWYLSATNTIEAIVDYAPFWSQIKNKDDTVNSSYGYRLFGAADFIPYNQWDNVKKILREDKDSRQAICHINLPRDYTEETKDLPCTLNLQFFIRENELHLVINMRSNDIILGFTNDVFQFTMLQELMLCQLKKEESFANLELGQYYHNAGSMHIYDRHFDMMDCILLDADRKLDIVRTEFALAKQSLGYDDLGLDDVMMNEISKEVFEDAEMPVMELNDTDIENLIKVEAKWRVDGNCSPNFDFDSLEEFRALSGYWKWLIAVCFAGVEIEHFYRYGEIQ